MKHLPLIISLIALIVAVVALLETESLKRRIEDFGLRPRAAVETPNHGIR